MSTRCLKLMASPSQKSKQRGIELRSKYSSYTSRCRVEGLRPYTYDIWLIIDAPMTMYSIRAAWRSTLMNGNIVFSEKLLGSTCQGCGCRLPLDGVVCPVCRKAA